VHNTPTGCATGLPTREVRDSWKRRKFEHVLLLSEQCQDSGLGDMSLVFVNESNEKERKWAARWIQENRERKAERKAEAIANGTYVCLPIFEQVLAARGSLNGITRHNF
jgi:hypothetical protein